MANVEILLLKKVGRHAWRLAWLMLGIQVITTAVGISMLKIIPKSYESTTTIRVERSQMINPLVRGLAVSSESEERIRSLREEILSRDYFDKIITRLALEPPNTPPLRHEALVQEMMKNTTIATRQRDTFQITYSGKEPKDVRDVTNLLAGIFIEDSLSNKSGEAGAAVEFLESQLEVYRKKLEESEAALRRFEERNVDQLPSNRAAHMSKVEQLRATLMELQNNLRQARIQRDLLNQQAAAAGSSSTEGAGSGSLMVVNPLLGQLREKEAHLRRLRVDYSDTYPDVVALRAEIAGLQKELERNPTVPAAQAMALRPPSVQDALSLGQQQQLELQIGALATREQQVNRELARFENKVQTIPEIEQQMSGLKRDYDVNNDIYNSILRRLEEAKVSRELEASKKGEVFRILQAAALPLAPSKPTRRQTVLLGVAAGLGLSALLVFLFAQHDTSLQSAEETKKLLDLKVLAGVPYHISKQERAALVLKAVMVAFASATYAGGVVAFLFWERLGKLLQKGL